ncbi:MAG: hypothetical protein IKE16_11190 [Solobacterium sp.]|nr:hypothetical protein [Solobacterium sp.]MBR2795199.1 hypothetical protein [Solobacterium sp.]
MEEMKKEMDAAVLSDEQLEQVDGGAKSKYVIERKETRFCPFCITKHSIAVIAGKHRVGRYDHTLYWCSAKRQYFIKATNGYFDIHDERLPTGTFNG